MAKENIKATAGKKRVTFIIAAQEANNVFLMGDFNNWKEKKHPMKKEGGDVWKKTIFLSPGRYEYRFLVDGKWEIDPNNDQLCENSFGTHNNFIVVK